MLGSPSGVVTGLRRDVACNVSKTKNRIAPRNVFLAQNAKSRLRPLGGLKPALRPSSGINTGLVKRRKCWTRQAVSLLGFTAAILAFETLQATSLHFSFCHSAAVLFQKPPSGVNAGLVKRRNSWTGHQYSHNKLR